MRRWLRWTATLLFGLAIACGGGGGGQPQADGDGDTADGDTADGDGSGGDDGAEPGWRSVLYPEDWSPDTTDGEGRFLPDVSYAGYRNGEADLPGLAGLPTVDVVVDHGADPSGATDATAAFQAALDVVGAHVVRVPDGLYRVDGLLTVTQAGVVVAGEGADRSRVYFTHTDAMTDKSHLTFRGAPATGAEHSLAADGEARSADVFVADAGSLAVGDAVAVGWVITDEFVDEHGMTGTWQAFNGTWQTVFRREVRAIDVSSAPHRVTLDVPLRYAAKVRDQASLRVETGYLAEVGVADLGLANAVAWDDAWANERAHVLALEGVSDAWVRGVASFPSPAAPASGNGAGAHLQSGGVFVRASKRVTIADCRMERAQNRGGGGCGYLFEVMQSSEVLTRDCVARAGRHNFIQNWGFGTTGCVWLRCTSTEGFAVTTVLFPMLGVTGYSEYHHSLATANLVDGGRTDDGWSASNRGSWSSGAGHAATGCVFWNVSGGGVLRSQQFGWGYVVGAGSDLDVQTSLAPSSAAGSAPEDWVEGTGRSADLRPVSLYEDQLLRRTGRAASR